MLSTDSRCYKHTLPLPAKSSTKTQVTTTGRYDAGAIRLQASGHLMVGHGSIHTTELMYFISLKHVVFSVSTVPAPPSVGVIAESITRALGILTAFVTTAILCATLSLSHGDIGAILEDYIANLGRAFKVSFANFASSDEAIRLFKSSIGIVGFLAAVFINVRKATTLWTVHNCLTVGQNFLEQLAREAGQVVAPRKSIVANVQRH